MFDPNKDELLNMIERQGEGASDFDIEEAIYWFANNYHGGQSSNLYSVLGVSEFRPGMHSNGPTTDASKDIYNWLVLEYTGQTSSTN